VGDVAANKLLRQAWRAEGNPVDGMTIKASVLRFDPVKDDAPRFKTYEIEADEPISAMALVARIHDMDPTFACRTPMCFKGVCGSCLLRVDGQNVRGCTRLVLPGDDVVIEPHSRYELIRDVVVDFSRPSGSTEDEVA
jgi:succinate dehydrogenase/fumarate reductase-like Fe-S protein